MTSSNDTETTLGSGLTREAFERVASWLRQRPAQSAKLAAVGGAFERQAQAALALMPPRSEWDRDESISREAAALGCLLALVREAWSGYSVELTLQDNGGAILRVMHPGNHLRCMFLRDSGADVLVAALESAP